MLAVEVTPGSVFAIVRLSLYCTPPAVTVTSTFTSVSELLAESSTITLNVGVDRR